MKWEFSNDAPIYAQLILQIKVGIVSGTFSQSWNEMDWCTVSGLRADL